MLFMPDISSRANGCQRYIELNPVRAGMVAHPAEYRWSSYRRNAQGEIDARVKAHSLYMALGLNDVGRQAAYRELFRFKPKFQPKNQVKLLMYI